MSINEVMKIGTKGMTQEQITAERERRVGVVERLNKIGEQLDATKKAVGILNLKKGSDAQKAYARKIRQLEKSIDRIKADESSWMKEAAWFLY